MRAGFVVLERTGRLHQLAAVRAVPHVRRMAVVGGDEVAGEKAVQCSAGSAPVLFYPEEILHGRFFPAHGAAGLVEVVNLFLHAGSHRSGLLL